MNQQTIQQLVYKAVRELYIDVPVYKVDDLGDHIRLYLYGGGVVDYPEPAEPDRPSPNPAKKASPARVKPQTPTPNPTKPAPPSCGVPHDTSPNPAKPGFREGEGKEN